MLDEIKKAIKEFQEVQDKYSRFGARDTEPNAIFDFLCQRAAKGEPVTVPANGEGWDLFTASMDCSEAAAAMYYAAKKVIDMIQSTPISQSKEVKKYFGAGLDF